MKLNRTQIAAVRREAGLEPLPEQVSAESGLAGALGDQTFYVDAKGVYVFEPVEDPSGAMQLMAIQLADVERAAEGGDEVVVRPVNPRAAGLTVDLG